MCLNIYSFINSRDIREHLQNIDYRFSSLEAAWLIWQSRYATLREKHAAWEELIQTMPDCEIERRPNTVPQPSLHGFLKAYMEAENRYIETVLTTEPQAIYTFRYYLSTGWGQGSPALSYSECLDNAVSACSREAGSGETGERRIQISKLRLNEEVGLEMTAEGEIMKVLRDNVRSDGEAEILDGVFAGLWFCFPTPFRNGDIICDPAKQDEYEMDGGPCVIEHEIPWPPGIERWKRGGDFTDMLVHGLFQMENGTVYEECTFSYMDFEYFRKPLTGKRRVLRAISNYLKGDISLDLLLNAYHTVIAEEQARDTRPWNITKEGLELAGIPERGTNG